MEKNNTKKIAPSDVNAIIAMVLSLIVVIGFYFWIVKDLFNLFHIGIGFKIAYFVVGFFAGGGLVNLILNTGSAMQKAADRKQ